MKRTWAKQLLLVLAVGAAIESPFLLYDAYSCASRAAAYERLALDLPRQDAVEVLKHEQIWCGLSDPLPQTSDGANTCRFSDFWRDCTVSVDSRTGLISSRSYRNRVRRSLLVRPLLLLRRHHR